MTNRHFAIMGLVGGALTITGSLLPWFTIATIGSSIGTDGDGVLTLGLGAVIVLASFIRYGTPSRTIPLVAAVLGALTIWLAASTIIRLAGIESDTGIRTSIGGGLYLVVLGGAAAILSGQRGKLETA